MATETAVDVVMPQMRVQEGETVEVGTKLAQIGGAPAGNGQAQPAPPEPATAPAAAEAEAASGAEGETPTAAQVEEARPAEPEPQPAPTPVGPAETAPPGDGATDGKSFVSPVVARIASEHGVDPGQVQGTGRGGRVTKKDILSFIEQGAPAAALEAPEAPPAPPERRPTPTPPAPPPTAPAAEPAVPQPVGAAEGE